MTAERQPEQRQQEGEDRSGTETRHSTDSQMLVNQLREVTGIQDAVILREALKASNNDVTRAVGFLTDECAKEPDSKIVAAEPGDDAGGSVRGLGDITHEKQALEAAIALSLQATKPELEGGDSNRSHESQANKSNSRPKRKRCEAWGDHPNPNDFRRVGDWPVGLKNIGNTCWFSAVIQSLFHLPEFGRLVFSYSISRSMLERCRSRSEKRNIAFMQELQCLFALMVGSNRRFVDPSAAVELLKDAFLSEEAQQQDVSEFTHKLLDWLEDAFQQAVKGENQREKSENPMVQLFYGTFLNEGFLEDKTFSNVETFGQYPLQVNGFNNLSECLEGAMVEGEIEDVKTGHTVKYRQERWFTKLPPVLTFELSRFEYNQSLGQPEKIHNRLEFPEIIFMDRYLHKNKSVMMKKREEVMKLKERIDSVHHKLERYMKYGSGPNRCPLPEMLQYVLEFASTKSAVKSQTSVTRTLQPTTALESSNSKALANGFIHSDDSNEDSANNSMESELNTSPTEMLPDTNCTALALPTPPGTTESELRSVEACLQRWIAEVNQDIQDMNDSVSNIAKSIEDIYIDPLLSQVPYRLHAVLVHEGQANAGHYWAYIYNHSRGCWLKCNDVAVSETTWEEVKRDSYGGMKNASAYCLMYINDKLPYLIAGNESGHLVDNIESLPPRLKCYVKEDNQRFEQEVEEWEEAYSCKIPQVESISLSESEELSTDCEASSVSKEECARSLSLEHAVINKEQTALAITKTAESYERDGVEAALQEAFREEYTRLYQLSKEELNPSSDPRLQHVLVYFFRNKAPERVIERTLLEQFADKNLSYDERSISIMKVAQRKLKEIGPNDMDMKEYEKWHEDYSLFRKVSVYLLTGLELYQNEKYQEALTYLIYAYHFNNTLLRIGPNRGVNAKLIEIYRRKCLVDLNNRAINLFGSPQDEQVSEGISIVNDLIIPSMHLMFNNKISEDDMSAIEDMRSCWCSFLGQDIDDNLQLKLSQFLPRLLDCSAEKIVLKEPPKIRPHSPYDLCSRFTAVMESIQGASAVTVT
ncbi:ubiquitin carboxyl-terminal hydrolase 28 isoform X7 [Pelobates cultripes]|uniref:ubiquitinyl hydrolase 1 n=1 Tax=Pelobates cultripes TaxID=61616 RepID=A0AAD1WP64_PELCU|nr:ubiquitin carboxyl-terminal hydrolase 28 isoform X8 [Pelobates cultripes]CAH2320143.1 ubiquitin carboxyl-terminal hydrolase 28 isoform X7 [Pelobates cultripes]